jgi:hypothetical protein
MKIEMTTLFYHEHRTKLCGQNSLSGLFAKYGFRSRMLLRHSSALVQGPSGFLILGHSAGGPCPTQLFCKA